MSRPQQAKATFKRGQAEWALWRWFAFGETSPAPRQFLGRIKRLLDMDRAERTPQGAQAGVHRYAFTEGYPGGAGLDLEFTAFDVFCLAVGLDMVDAGFKQMEVAFVVRHIRPKLYEQFRRALNSPPDPRQAIAAEDVPDAPRYKENGVWQADLRIYLILNRVEIREQFVGERGRKRASPLVLAPSFAHGVDDLRARLHLLDAATRRALVFEIANTAVQVSRFLNEAPETRRGRPKAA